MTRQRQEMTKEERKLFAELMTQALQTRNDLIKMGFGTENSERNLKTLIAACRALGFSVEEARP